MTTKADMMAAARKGALTALGMPSVVLLGGMIGLGALAFNNGFELAPALLSVPLVWALPGQLVMIEMYASGAGAAAVVATVAMINLRFLPMTVSLMPRLRSGVSHPAWQFPLAQLVSANSWLYGMKAEALYAPRERVAYFAVFGSTCMIVSLAGVIVGFIATTALPPQVSLGLVFLNAMFLTMLLAQNRERSAVMAVLVGAMLGPPLHIWHTDLGIPIAGIVSGTLAWLIGDKRVEGQS